MANEFTPTEDLLIELLISRHRLGEQVWTIDARHKQTAMKLAKRDLVNWKYASTEGNLLAWLTAKGKREFLSNVHISPIIEGSKKVTARAKAISKSARKG